MSQSPIEPRQHRLDPKSASASEPTPLERFIGGSPAAVILRLAILCVVVGLIMAVLGLRPQDVVYAVQALFDHIWAMGWGALNTVGGYLLLGAGVVIPVWLVIRLLKSSR